MLLLLAFAPAGKSQFLGGGKAIHGSHLYLDGKNILHNSQIDLRRDDLLRFAVYGVASNSSVSFKAFRGSIRIHHQTYNADGVGTVKEILFFPKAKSRIRCVVEYTTKNQETRKIEFVLDPVY